MTEETREDSISNESKEDLLLINLERTLSLTTLKKT